MNYAVGEFFTDRERYADRIFVSERTFAVADGMGKGVGGRMAAEKAISLLSEEHPFSSLEDMLSFFERANVEIMKEIAMLGDRHAAGTTLSLLNLAGGRYMVGHVGDSRVYLLREGRLHLLTEDQITYRGGKKYVTVLGVEWRPKVHVCEDRVLKGDTFLLISDGAVGTLSDEAIAEVLREDPQRGRERLLNLYREGGKGGDMAFVIVRID